jgi:hypothetical protein
MNLEALTYYAAWLLLGIAFGFVLTMRWCFQ